MSEKDTLMQIEADLQSGKDVVEWSAVRVMNEAERETERRFWRKHVLLKKVLLPNVMANIVSYILLVVYFGFTFMLWLGSFILCTITLAGISIGAYRHIQKHLLSKKSHALIHVNIDFKKESIYEQRLFGRESHKFRQPEQTLKLLPELPEDKSPETAALRQRVQTLLHKKTGLHFE